MTFQPRRLASLLATGSLVLLAGYMLTPQAQQIFAEEGFRPTDPTIWAKVNQEFFGDGGIWDRPFAKSP